MRFRNRTEAGRKLADKLAAFADRENVLVLALPRGGVPVAFEVAEKLHAPLDVFLVRKLGVPGNEELAMGAIATGGVRVMNDEIVSYLGISSEAIEQVTAREQRELERREKAYRDDRPQPEMKGRIVILVDDGMATGTTMQAAVAALRQHHPARIVVAAPVAARTTCEAFEHIADDIVCICDDTPESFFAVGLWYDDFTQTTDQEVCRLLERAAQHQPVAA